MHKTKFLHQLYLRMTRTKYVEKQCYRERFTLIQLAGHEAAYRASSEIALSTKACST